MDTLEAIRTIRSVREFETRPVSEEIITRILNAGRWSGSSKNTQPWQFIVIHDRTILVELSECGDFALHLAGADFAIALVTIADKRTDYDIGRCTGNMMLAAWNDGVGSCIAFMHRGADAKRVLGIPDTNQVHFVISFGYPSEKYIHPPRQGGRVALADILHTDRW